MLWLPLLDNKYLDSIEKPMSLMPKKSPQGTIFFPRPCLEMINEIKKPTSFYKFLAKWCRCPFYKMDMHFQDSTVVIIFLKYVKHSLSSTYKNWNMKLWWIAPYFNSVVNTK